MRKLVQLKLLLKLLSRYLTNLYQAYNDNGKDKWSHIKGSGMKASKKVRLRQINLLRTDPHIKIRNSNYLILELDYFSVHSDQLIYTVRRILWTNFSCINRLADFLS